MSKSIPAGYTAVTPSLIVRDAAAAIEFYKNAFGAEEGMRMLMPDGKVGHAVITIGGSKLMLADEFPDWGVLSPASVGGSPVTIHLYVPDADATFARAVGAGATVTMPPEDAFWGDRYGKLADPFGHNWAVATQQKQLTVEEINEAMLKAFAA